MFEFDPSAAHWNAASRVTLKDALCRFVWVRRETGRAQGVQVPGNKDVANYVVPGSCAAHREVRREALTGVPIGS
jgi:hypothetical protein